MFRSIVVGTDGSETASQAVRQAVELAQTTGARVELVSAYEPVSGQRLREESQQVPEDLQWMVNPREDVDATLAEAAEVARDAGVKLLALTHLSTRSFPREVRDEARAVFDGALVPRDFDAVAVPFPERGPPALVRADDAQVSGATNPDS